VNENDTYRVDRAMVRGDLPILLTLLADLFFGLWAWRRMPGPVWVVGGFVALAGAFLRSGAAEAVFLSVVAVLVVVPIVYSYRL
jgi:hypothetical protein